jgi:putative glutathione S-transferase
MGLMVDGVWHDVPRQSARDGSFVRAESIFRKVLDEGEAGRYHLYVAKSCPWAHRTMVVRALKGLEKAIPIFYAGPRMMENGWEFDSGGIEYLYQLYAKAVPGYSGRVTVPVLWDSHAGAIVNNESSEIIRMLNRAFDRFARRTLPDMYPDALRK